MYKKAVLSLSCLFILAPFHSISFGELPSVSPGEVGLSSQKLTEIHAQVSELVAEKEIPGAVTLIARHGKIAYFDAVGMRDMERKRPMEKDTIFRVYSMSKPITGVAMMILFDEGKFRLDDPVSKFLPEFKNQKVYTEDRNVAPDREMTILDLMRHTGGLTYGFFSDTPVDKMYREAGLLDSQITLEEMSKRLGRIPLLYQPGTRWHYSLGVDLQGRLVEVLSGQTFDRFLEERVFAPLGMKDTGFFVPAEKQDRLAACYQTAAKGGLSLQDDPATSNYLTEPALKSGGGGMVSTVRDYLRFAQMLLNRGELEGVRILEPETVDLMTRNHLPEGISVPWGDRSGFGIDLSIRTEKTPAARAGEYGWTGMATTRFFVCPSADLIGLSFTQRIMDSDILTSPLKKTLLDSILDQ